MMLPSASVACTMTLTDPGVPTGSDDEPRTTVAADGTPSSDTGTLVIALATSVTATSAVARRFPVPPVLS